MSEKCLNHNDDGTDGLKLSQYLRKAVQLPPIGFTEEPKKPKEDKDEEEKQETLKVQEKLNEVKI